MSQVFYLTPQEKQALAKKREANPDLPLTYVERGILRQAEETGREKVKAAELQREAARKAAIPEHERRPTNPARQILEMHKQDYPGHKLAASTMAKLRSKADIEDERIAAEMKEKQRLHAIATDPLVIRAVQHADLALGTAATDEERVARAELGAIAREGAVQMYWERATALSASIVESQKTQLIAEATAKSEAETKWAEQKRRSEAALAAHGESLAELRKLMDTPVQE